MSNRQGSTLPASLSKARRRFEHWRNRNKPRTRLPAELWSTAVVLAREHGLNKTAKTLGLDYYSLKKKLDTAHDPGMTAPEFIELIPAELSPSLTECTIELEDGNGGKMRIHIKGAELPDVAAITREFRRAEA